MTLEDIDGDGNLDLLTVKRSYYGYVNVFWGDGTGAFDLDNPQNYFVGRYSYPDEVKVFDFDGDGVEDIVAGNGRRLNVLPGLGSGNFEESTSYNNPLRYIQQSAFEDLNNDGIVDLVSLPYSYSYYGGLNPRYDQFGPLVKETSAVGTPQETVRQIETTCGQVLCGRAKQTWLKTFLELPNGIPSHDTFARN